VTISLRDDDDDNMTSTIASFLESLHFISSNRPGIHACSLSWTYTYGFVVDVVELVVVVVLVAVKSAELPYEWNLSVRAVITYCCPIMMCLT
jgi:hypothetical protein